MRNVIAFLLRYNPWILLAVYIVVSCILLFNFNNFQQSVYLTSANSISASLNGIYNNVESYVELRDANAALEAHNAALQAQVKDLQSQLMATREMLPDSTSVIPQPDRFSYMTASVIGNTLSHACNYITINKGSMQGVRPGMGVINSMGLIGIVDVCAPHISRVISVLNSKQKFSVKLSGTPYVGTLHWRPGSTETAYMEEVPRHAKFFRNSLIVTSGYSTALPEGIPVGKVIGSLRKSTDNYLTLKLELLPNFRNLQTVWVIKDIYRSELDSLKIEKTTVDKPVH